MQVLPEPHGHPRQGWRPLMRVAAETLETGATAMLKAERPADWRKRYDSGSLSAAVRAAAKVAHDTGAPAFVLLASIYGRGQWLIGNERDACSNVQNTGRRAYRITPQADVFRLTLEG
jgi:hypothetical protein